MAQARFGTQDPDFVVITRRFGAPKKMTLEAWFKAARKVIPQIPDPTRTDWTITHEEASKDAKWITFELSNTVNERCKLIIDRTIPLIG